jgi:RNA polymerase sigma-70 factor, ECF subfamily
MKKILAHKSTMITKEIATEVLPLNDTDLIKQTLAGNENAFGQLMQKYQPKFMAMGVRILGSHAEAEDVLQDSFIDAYRHLAGFQNKARFSTWLYTIVLNHIRNRLRHNKVLRCVPLEINSEDDDKWAPEIAEKNESFDVSLEHKMQLEAVHKAVATFPLQYQSIFIMHYFNDLPVKEIALRLNRPVGTVKAYLHRARKLLEKMNLGKAVAVEPVTDDLDVEESTDMELRSIDQLGQL